MRTFGIRIGYHGSGAQINGALIGSAAVEAIGSAFRVNDVEVRVTQDVDGRSTLWATWPSAPAWSKDVQGQIGAAVAPYLLACSVRTGRSLTVDWQGASYADDSGKRHDSGWTKFQSVRKREPFHALGSYADDAAIISRRPELLAAADECRAAFQLRLSAPAAAMGLSYLAIEGLVTHVLGAGPEGSRTSGPEWEKAAPLMGAQREPVLRLLWSTQLGRHVDPVRAKKKLVHENWTAYAAAECCDVAADIVLAYLATLAPAP